MQDYAYYNGVFAPYDSTTVPLSDRSIFFGDAVYDVIIGRCGVPYQAEMHIDRLLKNAEAIGLTDIPSKDELLGTMYDLLKEAGADLFTLYLQLSADGKRRAHSRDERGTNVLITVTGASLSPMLETVSAITLPDIRHGICNVKTTNLLLSVLSVREANRKGADLAIFHKSGEVTECSYANLCFYKNGVMISHPYDSEVLDGITQVNMEKACHTLGIATERRKFTLSELYTADFIITTSTTKLFKLCRQIDECDLEMQNLSIAKSIFSLMYNDFIGETGCSAK